MTDYGKKRYPKSVFTENRIADIPFSIYRRSRMSDAFPLDWVSDAVDVSVRADLRAAGPGIGRKAGSVEGEEAAGFAAVKLTSLRRLGRGCGESRVSFG